MKILGTKMFIVSVLITNITVILHGVKEYYELIDVKRVNGKAVQKYVGYLRKNPE